VARLDVPVPLDVRALCAQIARSRGRPIQLRPIAMPADSPCGVWLASAAGDYIFYEQHTSGLHQEHIILHELGHLLCDHHTEELGGLEISRLLMPNLDPSLVRKVLSRSHYSAGEEQEAELIASLILEHASRWQPASEWTGPADRTDIRGRLGGAFDDPDDRGR
jgi:hypothetical protein